MTSQSKMGIGGFLGVLGGAGLFVVPLLGWTSVGRPWSFLLGFVVGFAAAAGAALAFSGLLDRRRGVGGP